MFASLKPRRRKGKRRYISPGLGIAQFFARLNLDKIDYAALRWFEKLPALEPGEDIDLLVSDEHLELIETYLKGKPGRGIPVDLYTVSGLPGTDFRGVPYFPPPLAQKVLMTSVIRSNGVRAPDARHHLATMAYHALFHKGFTAGIPERAGSPVREANPEHDYVEAIRACAKEAGVVLDDISLHGLQNWLESEGWAPPADTAEKLAQRNSWLRQGLLQAARSTDPLWDGLAVFIVRDNALPHLPFILDAIWREGFDILDQGPIPAERRDEARYQIRGGNWHAGPWPQSGGGPAHVIVGYDVFPVEPAPELGARHFGLTNERVHRAKRKARDGINRTLPPERHFNALHSSDNPHQALNYLSVAWNDPARQTQLAGKIEALKGKVDTGHEIVQSLSRHGRRTAVWLIRFEGRLAVCKVFRPGRERYMERELLARQLAGSSPHVLPILARGERWIILPYLSNLETGRRFFRPGELSAIRKLILHYRAAGYELIDFKPGNVLIDRDEGLKVIDFEFMQPAAASTRLDGAFCWYRIPEGAGFDLPANAQGTRLNYHRFWIRRTGLPLPMAVRDLPPILTVPVQSIFGLFYWLQDRTRRIGRKKST